MKPLFRTYFALAAAQALWAAAALIRIPSDPKNALLFGLSGERLAMTGAAALVALAFLGLLAHDFRKPDAHARLLRRLEAALGRSEAWGWLVLGSGIAAFFGGLALAVLQKRGFHVLAPAGVLPTLELSAYFVDLAFFRSELYLVRLRPLIVLAAGLGLQNVVLVPLLRFGPLDWHARMKRAGVYAALLLLGGWLGLWWLLGGASLRLTPDAIGWNPTGAPLLDHQVLAAFLAAVLLLAAGVWLRRLPRFSGRSLDAALFILVWLSAALVWTGLPLRASWFLDSPAAPNFEFYPRSDAVTYDTTAQAMLAGEGLKSFAFDDVIVRRPLYSFFVGVVRAIAGQDYLPVSMLHAAVLAVFPALIYLFGTFMHSRLSGLLAAAFVILREANAILLADEITVSHSRLIMSDVPGAVAISLLIWGALVWLGQRSPGSRRRLLALGAFLGAAMLVRFESAILLPVLAAFAWWKHRGALRPLLRDGALFALGAFLFLAPWLARNYAKTGQLYLEVPGNRANFLINRLFKDTGFDPPGGALGRAAPVEAGQASNPAGQVAAHFLHSNVQTVLIFPSQYRLPDAAAGFSEHDKPDKFWLECCSAQNYVQRLPFWLWYKWDMSFPPETLLPIGVSLLVISTGIVASWKKRAHLVLLPIFAAQAYYAINAVARTSGGRYLLPVDWVWVGLFAVGLVQMASWLIRLAGARPAGHPLIEQALPIETNAGRPRLPFWGACALILAAGAVLPVGERLFPERYPDALPETELAAALAAAPPAVAELLQNNATILHGRALYPRYYPAGEFAERNNDTPFFRGGDPGIYFKVVGPQISEVIAPLGDSPAGAFPHAADVIVVGCKVRAGPQVFVVAGLVYLPDTGAVYSDPDVIGRLPCR